jgi:tyrosine-protein kinase Etk/Wzc
MSELDFERQQEENSDSLVGIDFQRLLIAVYKSWIWLLLFLILGLVAGYYVIKYSKPVYRASSLIKLEIQSDASDAGLGMGIGSSLTKQIDNLSGEIEMIKSPLVAKNVINQLNINASYYAIGKVLTTEIYKTTPFFVQVIDGYEKLPFNREIFVTFKNETEFEIGFENQKPLTHKIGDIINFNSYKIALKRNQEMPGIQGQKDFLFVMHDESYLTNYLLNNLEVNIVNKEAKTISIAFQGHNKEKNIDIVNAFDSVYLKHSLEKKQKSQDQSIQFIESQIENTSKLLEESELEIENFLKNFGSVSPEGEFSSLKTKLEALEIKQAELVTSNKSLDNVLKFVESHKSTDNIVPVIFGLENQHIANLIGELNKLIKEEELMKISNKDNTIAYRKISTEISIVKSQMIDHIIENKKYNMAQLKALKENINAFQSTFRTLPSKETEINRIKRYNALYEKFYLMLLDKRIQYQILKAGTVPEFVILSPAHSSSEPVSPQVEKIWFFALIGGLIPGFLFIGINYLLLNLILSPKEVEKKCKAPLLGLVPTFKKKILEHSSLIVDQNPKSAISEALRSIRSNTDFIVGRKNKTMIGVTSTVSGEGKTMFAINYAAVMAMSGKKVIVLDLDMRKPKIHLGFNTTNQHGMSSLLIGQSNLLECIKRSRLDGLDFITSGPIPPNPSELILKPEFEQLLTDLHLLYDVIMIDTPPIGLVTDSFHVLSKADMAVYIIRANYSKKSVIENINNIWKAKKFPNLSVVVNDVNTGSIYGYKYGYGDGYGYYEDDKKEKGYLAKLIQKN